MYRRPLLAGEKKEPFASLVLLGGTCVVGIYSLAKQTLLIPYYQQIIQLKDDNGPIEPSENLKIIFSEVTKDTEEFVDITTTIKPILVPGSHCLHAGTFSTHYGGLVGLPEFYEFNTNKDLIDKLEKINPDYFDGSGIEGVKQEPFLLSDKAKKYGIAHEILHINSWQFYCNVALPPIIAYSMTILTEDLSVSIISRYPMFVAGFYYTALVAFGVTLWAFAQFRINDYFESEIESDIVKLGEDYIEGGQEYYTKYIERESSTIDLTKNQKSTILYKFGQMLGINHAYTSKYLHLKKKYYDSLIINKKITQ